MERGCGSRAYDVIRDGRFLARIPARSKRKRAATGHGHSGCAQLVRRTAFSSIRRTMTSSLIGACLRASARKEDRVWVGVIDVSAIFLPVVADFMSSPLLHPIAPAASFLYR